MKYFREKYCNFIPYFLRKSMFWVRFYFHKYKEPGLVSTKYQTGSCKPQSCNSHQLVKLKRPVVYFFLFTKIIAE